MGLTSWLQFIIQLTRIVQENIVPFEFERLMREERILENHVTEDGFFW